MPIVPVGAIARRAIGREIPSLSANSLETLFVSSPIEPQPIVKFGRHLVAIATLEHPFVDAHQPDAEPAILLTDLLNFLVRQISPKRPTEQELRGQFEDRLELLDAFNPPKVDAAEIAYVGVVATDDLGAGISQCIPLLLKQVEREARLGRGYGLQHVSLEQFTRIAGLTQLEEPRGIVVDRDVRHVQRCRPILIVLLYLGQRQFCAGHNHFLPVLHRQELLDITMPPIQRSVDRGPARAALHDVAADLVNHQHLRDRPAGEATRAREDRVAFAVDRIVDPDASASHQTAFRLPTEVGPVLA